MFLDSLLFIWRLNNNTSPPICKYPLSFFYQYFCDLSLCTIIMPPYCWLRTKHGKQHPSAPIGWRTDQTLVCTHRSGWRKGDKQVRKSVLKVNFSLFRQRKVTKETRPKAFNHPLESRYGVSVQRSIWLRRFNPLQADFGAPVQRTASVKQVRKARTAPIGWCTDWTLVRTHRSGWGKNDKRKRWCVLKNRSLCVG